MACVVTVLVAVLASAFLQPVMTVNPPIELDTLSRRANGKLCSHILNGARAKYMYKHEHFLNF